MIPTGARLLSLLTAAFMITPGLAESPAGCKGSSALGTFRILVRRSAVGVALPIKSLSAVPVGAHFIWDPVRLANKQAESAEVAAILVPMSGDDLVVLDPQRADGPAEWEITVPPAAIALVYGPQGLSISKVKSLVTRNRQLVDQLADYAEQTSKVEDVVQALSDAEKSGSGIEAALKGVSARFGVATPKLDATASTGQQASVLLKTLLPSASSYDPLAARNAQVQQSGGLAAAVAGMFFGNAAGLAAGGAALFENVKTVFFPDAEFRSAFAQNEDHDGLALCAKSQAQKARIRVAYLWAYRVPNYKRPSLSLAGPANLPIGLTSTVSLAPKAPNFKPLELARDWRLVAVSGGTAESVAIHAKPALDSLELDLSHTSPRPGDYKLAASWDWGTLDIDGVLHLRPLGNASHIQMTPASRDQLVEGNGRVSAKLTGTDFEFLEKVTVAKAEPHPAPSTEIHFVLPLGKRAGEQNTVDVDLDTAARGAYVLTLTQSGGGTHEVPFTVQPPNPVITGLPVRVNLGETSQSLRFAGTDLRRIEAVFSEAGEIQGGANASGWAGSIRLKPGRHAGESLAVSLKVKGLDGRLTVPDAIRIVGPRPSITEVKKSAPGHQSVVLKPNELPSGTAVGLAIAFRRFHDASADADEPRVRVELACKSAGLRKALSLSPEDRIPGAELSAPAPGMLFLSIDPGTVGFPGCTLTAAVDVEPEGSSDSFTVGRIVRVPRLDQFILTAEQLGPSTYAGVLKGRDLDVVEKVGWDAQHGLHVDSVPAPVPGEPSVQTVRIALPWPAPAPHAPLYVWLHGEDEGRKTDVTY